MFQGENLHYAVTISDVKVRIGNSMCEVISMKSVVLYCKPLNKPASVSDNEPRRTVEVHSNVNSEINVMFL